ncbi:MAG TPA: DUF4430 domain-containing protein [Ignavibacteria bacterium]|nr:DUF4430 domain-containing protein [Ignavibacteria bacterium]
MFKTKNQEGFISILVLLIAVSIIGYFLYKSLVQVGDNPQTEGFKRQIDKAEDIAKIAVERAGRIKSEMSDYADKRQSDKEDKINVIVKIISKNNPGEYSEKVNSGISVLNLMELIGKKYNLSFKYSESGSGMFVDEINGVKNNSSDNTHWLLYVNGKIIKAGISDYKLSDNDIIEWRYEGMPAPW